MVEKVAPRITKQAMTWGSKHGILMKTYPAHKLGYAKEYMGHYTQLIMILYCMNETGSLVDDIVDLLKAKVPYENIFEFIRIRKASA